MMTDKEKVELGNGCLTLLLVPAMTLVDLWAIVKLWGWYMVPTFGLPAINKRVAFGFWLMYLVIKFNPAKKTDPDFKPLNTTLWGIAAAVAAVIIGYYAH